MRTTRRAVLKAGGVVGSVALAGCAGALGGGGTRPRDWQYDPEVLSDTPNTFFGTVDHARLYRDRRHLPDARQQAIESSAYLPRALDAGDVDAVTGVGGMQFGDYGTGSRTTFGSVTLLGSFERESVERSVRTEGDPESRREYRGFSLYEGVDGEEAGGLRGVPGGPTPFTMTSVAVGDGAMVVGAVTVRGRNAGMVLADDAVEAVVDAVTGNAPRLHEAGRYADRLYGLLEGATVVAGLRLNGALLDGRVRSDSVPGRVLSGLQAGGLALTVDGATTEAKLVGFYEEPAAAEATGVVALLEDVRGRVLSSDAVASVDATYEGRTVVVTVEGDTGSLLARDLTPV